MKSGQSDDTPAHRPFLSFSHIAGCYSGSEGADGEYLPSYGFESPREEILYETASLARIFLKC